MLTRKEIAKRKTLKAHWGPETDRAFVKVKELLTSAPVLRFPDFKRPFVPHVDTSDYGAGGFLAQKGDDGNLAICSILQSEAVFSYTERVLYCRISQPLATLLMGQAFDSGNRHPALQYLYAI